MSSDLFDRLKRAIDKYEQRCYTENDFHSTLASIIQPITELHLSDVRSFLLDAEADLELIDFMVSEINKREEYLKVISQIKDYMQKNNFS